MQINLKQTELVAAIKGYIAAQGINLTGKTVTVTFTAGRKESGISAEVAIDDKEGYVPHEPVKVQLQQAKEVEQEEEVLQPKKAAPSTDTLHFSKATPIFAAVNEPVEDEAAPIAVKTVSLFG